MLKVAYMEWIISWISNSRTFQNITTFHYSWYYKLFGILQNPYVSSRRPFDQSKTKRLQTIQSLFMNHDCPLSCTEVELATFPSAGFTISSEGCSEVNKPERNLVNLTFVSWTVKFFFSTSRLARLETLPSIQNLQRFVTTNKMLSCKVFIIF